MLNKSIRKISVGADVNNQLHISVGSRIGGNIVSVIKFTESQYYEVWVKIDDTENESIWKTIENMPVIVEYDTRLE